MAKAVVSSGGGGSFGKGVSWKAELFAKHSAPAIPADATCASEFGAAIGKGEKRAGDILRDLAKGGGWVKAYGKKAGEASTRCWYWPAKQ